MGLVKNISRKVVLPALLKLKADRILLKRASKSCCIINFHGVRNGDKLIFNNRHIPVNEFEKIISYLNENYKIVPLSDIFEMHRNKIKQNKKTIALTFDDGYENNFSVALPVLKKYNVPGTFYLITKGLIDRNFYVWPDKIDIIRKHHSEDLVVKGKKFKAPFYRDENELDILDFIKTCGKETESIADALSEGNKNVKDIIEKAPELIELIREKEFAAYKSESLIEYGSHTHSHPNLEYLDKESLKNELQVSKDIIERLTGRKVVSHAFPDGSYNSDVLDTAREIGYHNLVAVNYKFHENNATTDLLSRFTISNSTTFESNMIRLAKDFDKYGFN